MIKFDRPKLHLPGVGFYIALGSLVFTIVAFILYGMTFDAFHYDPDKWVTALLVIAIWCFVCIFAGVIFSGNNANWTGIMYYVAAFALTLALIKFLTPCLSPIGIYFTVHNMGDVEANAVGVPRSIVTIVMFVLAIVSLIVSAFFGGALGARKKKGIGSKADGDAEKDKADSVAAVDAVTEGDSVDSTAASPEKNEVDHGV